LSAVNQGFVRLQFRARVSDGRAISEEAASAIRLR
jgi:hypothetical protein